MSNSKTDRKGKPGEMINLELVGTKKANVDYRLKLEESQQLCYPELVKTTKNKLNNLLEEVNTKVSIDYSNQEIRDVQAAVYIMLERVVERVNKRGMFKICRIEPCGSTVEQTSVWKYYRGRGERHTEFDFLAVLDCFPVIICRDNECRQCVGVSQLPVHKNRLYENGYSRLWTGLSDRVRYDKIFRRELNTCLVSACDCFSLKIDDRCSTPSYSYKPAPACKSGYRCGECVVEMPTGILRVNHSVSVGGAYEDAHCSLVFRWISKANTLLACDIMLNADAREINALSIHVDFLPAIEVLKAKPDKDVHKHDFFLVPKYCNGCGRGGTWRKSDCMTEIEYIVKEMSEKHRKCYKIIKYCLSTIISGSRIGINWYYVKTVALNHSRECSDTSEDCAECVLKMLIELKHVYETKTLYQFHEPGVNAVRSPYETEINRILQCFIEILCSVTKTISCDMLLQEIDYMLAKESFMLISPQHISPVTQSCLPDVI